MKCLAVLQMRAVTIAVNLGTLLAIHTDGVEGIVRVELDPPGYGIESERKD